MRPIFFSLPVAAFAIALGLLAVSAPTSTQAGVYVGVNVNGPYPYYGGGYRGPGPYYGGGPYGRPYPGPYFGRPVVVVPPPRYYPPVVYAQPPVVYAQPPVVYVPPPPVVYVQPRQGPVLAASPASQVYQRADGKYCREYNSTARIDGRNQAIYGTACMQQDGSWQLVN